MVRYFKNNFMLFFEEKEYTVSETRIITAHPVVPSNRVFHPFQLSKNMIAMETAAPYFN